jgi:hypothetical protein
MAERKKETKVLALKLGHRGHVYIKRIFFKKKKMFFDDRSS